MTKQELLQFIESLPECACNSADITIRPNEYEGSWEYNYGTSLCERRVSGRFGLNIDFRGIQEGEFEPILRYFKNVRWKQE